MKPLESSRPGDFLVRPASPEAALEELRARPADKILDGLQARFPIAIDGWFFPKPPAEIYASGEQNLVATMAGTNRDEGTMFAPFSSLPNVKAYETEIEKRFGDNAATVLQYYDVREVKQIRPALIQQITDIWFVQPTRQFLRNMSSAGNETWMYHFTRTSPSWPWLGAAHAAELAFVFDNLGDSSSEPKPENRGSNDRTLGAIRQRPAIPIWMVD